MDARAKIFAGQARHDGIADRGALDQRGLDLGGIDVGTAAQDEVGAPVRQEQKTILEPC